MYVIIIEYGESPTEVIGPFDSKAIAQGFAEYVELGGYSIIEMYSPVPITVELQSRKS